MSLSGSLFGYPASADPSGCYFYSSNMWRYLPQVSLNAHATVLSSAARTTLTQIFVNPSESILEEVSYKFPLYDGVSVVGFQCRIGSRLLHSKVKSKEQANADYKTAVANNESAAIMDHSTSEGDVFSICLGNVPAKETITVDITFVGELKQDAEIDGIRYTLPSHIAPRYQGFMGTQEVELSKSFPASLQGIFITTDVLMEKTSILRELQSPSHSIKVSLGRTSFMPADSRSFEPSQASATLRLSKDDQALHKRDFVLIVKADGLDSPRALLESHPTIPGQRAVMATLVPKFGLPSAKPEIMFVIDRSGSMADKIPTLKSALKVFLKSLPVGVCFNICSFGSCYSFLWPSSKAYDASSLQEALFYVESIESNMGGTEMHSAIESTTQQRLNGRDLEVLVLTDGQIRDQQSLFGFVREAAADNTARFFALGIGNAVSHSLIEGIARNGNGISQTVINYEDLDRKVVRMLKGSLSPHVYDYKLDIKYDTNNDHDFEVVGDAEESLADPITVMGDIPKEESSSNPISLFDDNFTESDPSAKPLEGADQNIFGLKPPKILQAPYKIPPLYPFIRTTVYLLLDPEAPDHVPQTLTFSATSKQGPLRLSIPIGDIGKGETIHQLASRKAVVEMEEQNGWLEDTNDKNGNSFRDLHQNTKQLVAARECQNLGVKYQVTGKYCSFVALENNESTQSNRNETERAEVSTVAHIHYRPNREMTVKGKKKKAAYGQPIQPSGAYQMAMVAVEPSVSCSFAAAGRPMFGQSSRGGFGSQESSAGPPRPNNQLFLQGDEHGYSGQTGAPQHAIFSAPPPPSSGNPFPGPQSSSLFGRDISPPTATLDGLFGDLASTNSQAQPTFGSVSSSPAPPGPSPTAFGTPAASKMQNSSPFGGPSSFGGVASKPLFGMASASTRGSSSFGSAASSPVPPPSLFGGSETPAPQQPGGLGGRPSYPSKIHALVSLQSFQGNWFWNHELFNLLECDMDEMRHNVIQLLGKEAHMNVDEANVVATLLAMGFMENKNARSKDVWELVHDKAQTWVQDKLNWMGVDGELIQKHEAQIKALV